MKLHSLLWLKYLWPWVQPCGVVLVASILVLAQLYLAVDFGWVGIAVAMPLTAAGILLLPPVRRSLVASWEPGHDRDHPTQQTARLFATLTARGLRLFVPVGGVVAITRLFVPALADWVYTSTSVPSWGIIVGIVIVGYSLMPHRNAPTRELQRGTAFRDTESARQAVEQRMKEWEKDDAQ